ncbi:MAG: hypothetical protein H7Y12_15315, partial [Sphingobacteriaceae bacterium]|nr:hypothetical protein [Cytophagaceae bacterium]
MSPPTDLQILTRLATVELKMRRLIEELTLANRRLAAAVQEAEELRSQNRALVVSDTDDMPATHIDKTADWGYLRLRRVNYSEKILVDWLERIRGQDWKD